MNDSSSLSPDGFLLPKWWELTFHRPIWQVSYSIFLCECDVHRPTLQPSLCSLSLLSSAFSLSLLLVHSWILSQWPLTTVVTRVSLHEPQLANNQSLGGSWHRGWERKNWLPNVSEKVNELLVLWTPCSHHSSVWIVLSGPSLSNCLPPTTRAGGPR